MKEIKNCWCGNANLHYFSPEYMLCDQCNTLSFELGCSHGGFVGLLQQTGYEASGLEMSPWVVEFAHKTFAIPIMQGLLEQQDIPQKRSFGRLYNTYKDFLNKTERTLCDKLRLI